LSIPLKNTKDFITYEERTSIENTFRIKESSSMKTITLSNKKQKKMLSLSKLKSFENSSPYKKKLIPSDQNKLQII